MKKQAPIAQQPPLKPEELVTIEQGPDGTANIALQRYGKAVISLPNSAMQIEIHVANVGGGKFMTLVETKTNPESKHAKATEKANAGKAPGFSYFLTAEGKFRANGAE